MPTATSRSSPKTPARNARRSSFSYALSLGGTAALLVTALIVSGLLLAGSVQAWAFHDQQSSNVQNNIQKNVPSGNPQKGKFIFESLGCDKCHGSLGEGLSTPGQKGGVPRIAATSLALPDFVQLVRHPKGQMPAFDSAKVSDSDLADVYAFLKYLAPRPQQEITAHPNIDNSKIADPKMSDTQVGQGLYINNGCYECHGYQGQGATQTGGTRLGPPQIPLSAFISYVRQPSGQMPPYTSKVISNEDLAHIYSFLQSVAKPPPAKSILLLNQ